MRNLHITMTTKEKLFCAIYFVFHLWGFPEILVYLNRQLPTPLSSAWVNFIYFATNFLVVVTILRGFLKRERRTAITGAMTAISFLISPSPAGRWSLQIRPWRQRGIKPC